MNAVNPKAPLIVLVDHSRGALMFQETVLRRRERLVLSTTSGREALAHVEGQHPRLVIFGFELDDMTAPEFCRLVRDSEESKSTSLLFVADRKNEDHVDLCMAAGCNDIIFRPLHAEELDAKVERLTAIPVRRQLRTLTKIEMTMERSGYYILGHSLNISANGMFVECEHVLPANADVRLQFYISGDSRPLVIEARIVRAEFSGGAPKYGMQFTRVSSEERDRIGSFVQRLRARELH